MPRTSASNGIRPELRALAVFTLNKPVTPQQVNDQVGTGNYAAKFVSILNSYYGCKITAQKDGRAVVSYTLVAEPDNIADLRAVRPDSVLTPRVLGQIVTVTGKKTVKPKAVKSKSVPIKTAAPSTKKPVVRKPVRSRDEVEETFGSSGVVHAVDSDWDSVDGLNIKQLL